MLQHIKQSGAAPAGMAIPWKHWGKDKKEGNEDFYQPAPGRGGRCLMLCDTWRCPQPWLHRGSGAGTQPCTAHPAALAAAFCWFGGAGVDQSSAKVL